MYQHFSVVIVSHTTLLSSEKALGALENFCARKPPIDRVSLIDRSFPGLSLTGSGWREILRESFKEIRHLI